MHHDNDQHSKSEQMDSLLNKEKSPTSSPSRKKTVFEEDVVEVVDMFESPDKEEIEVDEQTKSLLEDRIKQLELVIQADQEEKDKLKLEINKFKCKNSTAESAFGGFTQTINKKPFKIPDHLDGVQDKHLTRLRGFKMRYCAIPDGACLTNCLTAHISCTEDEIERRLSNMRVNHHIADNFDSYYKNKFILTYIETIRVGVNSRTVKCSTREEFLSFLRSEESLCAFSNSQEILAIPNMLNITVRIFSFGINGDESRCEWTEVIPDPQMSATAHFPQGWVPDLYLYNSDQSHYDLLVAEDHRLALLGLIGSKKSVKEDDITDNNDCLDHSDDGWKSVRHKKKQKNASEKILKEDNPKIYNKKDFEELNEEVSLSNSKAKDIEGWIHLLLLNLFQRRRKW